jgi:hypothetical protein
MLEGFSLHFFTEGLPMAAESLIQLIYVSEATRPLTQPELLELLEESMENNRLHNITGILLYYKESFFQVLEGGAETVGKLYEKICKDSRNRKNTVLMSELLVERQFEKWSMGYTEVTQKDLASIEALNDLFFGPNCFMQLAPSDITVLMAVFQVAEWISRFEEHAISMKSMTVVNNPG